MKCPKCGETKIQWQKELWGAGKEQFWQDKKEVMFICGGKYLYDKTSDSYKELKPCRRNHEK